MAGFRMSSLVLLLLVLAVGVVNSAAEGSGVIERACVLRDVNIDQRDRGDGSYIVAVNNGCFNRQCLATNVNLSCPSYAPTGYVPSSDDIYRIQNTDICVVNNNLPIVDLASFLYSQSVMVNFTVIHVDFVCN